MKLQRILSFVTGHPQFLAWKERNPGAELVHVFVLREAGAPETCDVGYYNEKTGVMASFTVAPDHGLLKLREDDEILKDAAQQIQPLSIADVLVEFDDALEKATTLQQQKYTNDSALKHIVILQKLPIGQVWNITFVTRNFKTLNIKIDTTTGRVLEDKLHSIIEFGPRG